MFKCIECSKLFSTILEIKDHLKYVHAYGHVHFTRMLCPNESCNVEINSWDGLWRHLKSFHESSISSGVKQLEVDIVGISSSIQFNSKNNDLESDNLEIGDAMSVDFGIKLFKDLLHTFCSALLSKGVNNSMVDYIVKEMQYTFSQIFKFIIKVADRFFQNNSDEFSCQVNGLLSAFKYVKSSYQRDKLFLKYDKIVQPVQITLGSRIEMRIHENKRQQIIVPDTFMYVPILKTLEGLLSCKQFSKYFSVPSDRQVKMYESFNDSNSFKNNTLFSRHSDALQIQIFYDDFETVNPLGSKRGIHKLGALYFVLRNFPDSLNSQLNNIHLLALFYSEDAKKYGYQLIFDHIIPDIKILETKGIELRGKTFFGTVCALAHDNLGANSILGFQESFNATHYCRICCISKYDAQNIFEHSKFEIRNRENLQQHLTTFSHGVVRSCPLNDLNFYNYLDSPTVDIMHDMLEGVVPFEIKIVLQKLISLGCFSLDVVNNRLMAHDFGRLESKNRPSPIKLDGQGNRIGQKAAQAWCLIRFLPVIIGDLIRTNEQKRYWELLIQLLECMSFAFCRKFSETIIDCLERSIIKHHNLFREIFPNTRLIPKHHFMCHYPYVIRQSGPLISLWTMRFEGKHNYFVQLASHIRNFRNICYSLAARHQQYSAHAHKEFSIQDELEVDNVTIVNLSDFEDGFDILECIRLIDGFQTYTMDSLLWSTNKIAYKGCDFKRNYVVCFDMGPVFPRFGIITDMLVVGENKCLLVVKQLGVTLFDRHFFAYKVAIGETIRICAVENLVIHECMEIQTNCQAGGLFISLRHHL